MGPGDLFSPFPPGQIIPAHDLKGLYIRAMARLNPDLSKKELAARLGLAFNTFSKYFVG